MNGAPLVSIVMAAHNAARFIGPAIESLLSQTFEDWELVAIDDGSTDGTATILEGFQDSRIRVYRQENRGLTKSLNSAIAISHGQFIARMDADDLCAPTRLEKQLALLNQRPEVGAVGSWYVMFDDDEGLSLEATTPVTNEEIQRLIPHRNVFVHGSVIFRRECLDLVGGYDEEFRYLQDWELWRRIARRYELCNIPELLYYWRLRKGSIASTRENSLRDTAGIAGRYHLLWARAFLRESKPELAREQLSRARNTGTHRLMSLALWVASWLPTTSYQHLRGLWTVTVKRFDVWRRAPGFKPWA